MSEGQYPGHHSSYYPQTPQYYPSQQYYGLQPTLEQSIRRAIVLELLSKGQSANRIEQIAERLVEYVMKGRKPEPDLKKKLEVKLPPDETAEAHGYLLDDNTIQIEFKDPELAKALFENLDLYGLSFYAIPALPVDTSKDI